MPNTPSHRYPLILHHKDIHRHHRYTLNLYNSVLYVLSCPRPSLSLISSAIATLSLLQLLWEVFSLSHTHTYAHLYSLSLVVIIPSFTAYLLFAPPVLHWWGAVATCQLQAGQQQDAVPYYTTASSPFLFSDYLTVARLHFTLDLRYLYKPSCCST